MSNFLLQYSMFNDVFFPSQDSKDEGGSQDLSLRRSITYFPDPKLAISGANLAVFDLETTGLDAVGDRIVEIGALKICNGQVMEEFETLLDPERDFPIEAQKVSGITPDMLEGKPNIAQVLPDFLKFIDGCILVAHNANFDMGFIRNNANRLGIDLQWPSFCTLKLARELLPDLERKTLDMLAEHYGLSFEARHRSIGDVKVTVGVLEQLMKNEGSYLHSWKDMEPFSV
ncbi:MAG: PolC-type DNA polymerase III [Oligoflexales bacterium]